MLGIPVSKPMLSSGPTKWRVAEVGLSTRKGRIDRVKARTCTNNQPGNAMLPTITRSKRACMLGCRRSISIRDNPSQLATSRGYTGVNYFAASTYGTCVSGSSFADGCTLLQHSVCGLPRRRSDVRGRMPCRSHTSSSMCADSRQKEICKHGTHSSGETWLGD